MKFIEVDKNEIDEFYKKISSNIKRIRQKKKINQLDVAINIDINSAGFYADCENNKNGKKFNLEHLYKIAKFLEVDMCDLFI